MHVSGARLQLTAQGSAASQVTPGANKPLTIEFHGRYLRRVREDASKAEFALIASLEASITRDRTTRRPRIDLGGAAALQHVEAEPPPDVALRELAFEFTPNDFVNAPDARAPSCRLRLPTPPSDQPEPTHFELTTVLRVAGSEEAPLGACEVLDVPLRPIRVGLVLEWPLSLDESLPPDLQLSATQGGKVRTLPWQLGELDSGRRRFLFRDIIAGPVDLRASTGKRTIVLWEAQDPSDTSRPVVWKNTLEQCFAPVPLVDAEPEFTSEGVLLPVVEPAVAHAGDLAPELSFQVV